MPQPGPIDTVSASENNRYSLTRDLKNEMVRLLLLLEAYQAEAHHAAGGNHAAAKRATLDVSRKLIAWRKGSPYVETEDGFTFK